MFRDFLRSIWSAISGLIQAIIASLFPSGPVISGFSPATGWPGTVIVVTGNHFAPGLDENLVRVGGRTAKVLDATPTQMRVLTGHEISTGPIEVTVAGQTGTSTADFVVQQSPDQGDITHDGPVGCVNSVSRLRRACRP